MNFFEIVGAITTAAGLTAAVMWAIGVLKFDIGIRIEEDEQ
ncbi:hypothetical protein [Achromobacter aegrifaciens]